MFDFISVTIKQQIPHWEQIPHLIFKEEKQRANKSTGEILNISSFKYKNMDIDYLIDSGNKVYQMNVRGSIHYLLNDGEHNANRLTYNDFKKTVSNLTNAIQISPSQCILKPFEFGYNIYIPNHSKIPEQCLIQKRKPFRQIPKGIGVINGTAANEYQIKIYDKSHQFPLYAAENTLRVEVKYNKTRQWTTQGICTLKDLLNKDNYDLIFESYIKTITSIGIIDDAMQGNLIFTNKVLRMLNPSYWSRQNLNSSKYNYTIKYLDKMSEERGVNLKQSILDRIHIEYGVVSNS